MRRLLCLGILLLAGIPAATGQVKVWEGTMPLAASDEGPPDQNPPFDAFSELENYPYTMRTNVRATETVHAWRALFLENEYLRCTILPDLGGHIYTCIDKLNGKSMFYANPSFKKALIAYRGAWSAYGEEFNFPVSHNWVTMSPVAFAYSTAPDGSASVTVGNRDRVYNMDWAVEITLRPGSTLLEEKVKLSNPTDVRHHFFWWNNTGIEVWPDSRLYYPMQFTRDNGSDDIDTWPVNSKGIDLSLVSKATSDFEAFAYGSNEPYMGIYHPHTDSGVVHWADFKELPAKKIFGWGNDANALDWRKRLSDNSSAYVELQSGLFKDQVTYQFLEPQQSIRFSEYWMPVRGLGSITRANLHGVVSIERQPQPDGRVSIKLAFNANHDLPGAKIVVSDGEKAVFEDGASLTPAVTWTHLIHDLPAGKTYSFELTSADGKSLLKHTEGVYDMLPRDQVKVGPHPPPATPDPKMWSDADFLRAGNDREIQGDYLNARDNYALGLAKFPDSPALLEAAGRLAVSLWQFESASTLLARAETKSPAGPETHYYRGIAETALGHTASARTELASAGESPAFRTTAGILLAESLARQHDIAGAIRGLLALCSTTSEDARCVEELVALKRASGDVAGAHALAAESLRHQPTSQFLRNELAKLAHNGSPALDRHLAADTNRILNLVLEYNRLGLYADALEILSRSYPVVAPEESEPNAPIPANDPILAYYRGYCREKLGQSGTADYAAASALPLLYVFPNQPDEINVLHAALAANPSDASAHFLLGALLFSKGQVDPALAEWKQAESLNPQIPSLQASVGRALFEVKKQSADAAAEFQRGLLTEPANPALYLGLDQTMQQMGKSPAQRAEMMKAFPDPVNMPENLVRALVDALRQGGKTEEADAVLAHRFIPRKEGETPLKPQ